MGCLDSHGAFEIYINPSIVGQWWKKIEAFPMYSPDPAEIDWRLLFAVNKEDKYCPVLLEAGSGAQ
jgi:hypothetical protein